MTYPFTTSEVQPLIGPAERTVADIRAALDALKKLDEPDARTEKQSGQQTAVYVARDRCADADDRPAPPGAVPLSPGMTDAQTADLLAAAPEATLTRTVLVLNLNLDDTAGAASYTAHDAATGTLLTSLMLDPATLADLDTPQQVTVTIQPGDRLNSASRADPSAPALTDVLLAERTVDRAAVAYAATDPRADLTTRMQAALAEAAEGLANPT
jgi:hypothetical protein